MSWVGIALLAAWSALGLWLYARVVEASWWAGLPLPQPWFLRLSPQAARVTAVSLLLLASFALGCAL